MKALKITALSFLLLAGASNAKAGDNYEYAVIYTYQPEGTTDNSRDVYIVYSDRPKEVIELGLLRTKLTPLTEAKLKEVSKKVTDGWEVYNVTEGAEGFTYHLRKKK